MNDNPIIVFIHTPSGLYVPDLRSIDATKRQRTLDSLMTYAPHTFDLIGLTDALIKSPHLGYTT